MSDKKILDLHYPVGVEYFVPSPWDRNSKRMTNEEKEKWRVSNNAGTTPYIPDIITGDMVRWAVPAGKGKRDQGAPILKRLDDAKQGYYRSFDDLLRYEDIALVLETRVTVTNATTQMFVHVLTSHGIGWVEARWLSRVNKR